jgi:hypothetical protein
VSLRRPAGQRPRFEDGAETVVWNETPDKRVPLRCFAEDRVEGTASAKGRRSWRSVTPMTPEFIESMHRAIEIYLRVQREGRAGPPVG